MMHKFFKKFLPTQEELNKNPRLKRFIKYFSHPYFWETSQFVMAKGASIGMFVAFLPVPGQMIFAFVFALLLRANLPLSIALTWITNPFTFVPINYFIYWVGRVLTQDKIPYHPITEFDWASAGFAEARAYLWKWLASLGKPFLVGIPVVAFSAAFLGYLVVWLVFVFIHAKKKHRT